MKKPSIGRLVTDLDNFKYAPKASRSQRGRARKMFPDNWVSGPDPVTHDMYYAWLKHRSQAHYRREPYDLTWADWQTIWTNPEDFQRRGRKPDDLTLTRIDWEGAWTISNVIVVTRREQIQMARDKTMQIRQRTRLLA